MKTQQYSLSISSHWQSLRTKGNTPFKNQEQTLFQSNFYQRILYPSLFHLAESRKVQIKWVGLITLDEYTPEEQEQIRAEIEKYNAYPVFVDKKTLEDCTYYYDSVITPIFHNFVSYKNNTGLRNADLFQAYRNVNKAFASTILSVYKKDPRAMILFNDPYFLLAPRLISESESPHMGYFFHSPFPSYEVYRIFPAAQEFMESLLCCDIVGFQVYEYARHFFTSCHRLLGLEAESRRGGMIGIIYKGRDVIIRVGHIGISKDFTDALMQTKEFNAELAVLQRMARNRIVIASVDKLSPISGIKNKLIAYKDLLEQYPGYRYKLLMIQYCTPGTKWGFTEETSKEIKELVKEINSKFPDSVKYEEASVSNEKRLALFTVAEILLVTSLRDGFCLLPFEFLLAKDASLQVAASKDWAAKTSQGSIILSEFAGCVTAMSSICRINPYTISDITYSILNAIEMQATLHKNASFQHDIKYIEKHDTANWLQSLIKDMKRGHNKNEAALYLGAIDKKILKAGRSFKNLLPVDLEKDYAKAVNRVILLDGEGTIIPTIPQAVIETTEVIPVELLQLLETLCSDERNSVYILSGKPKHLIDRWFASVNKLGLGAEYGYHYRSNTEKEWKVAPVHQNKDWKVKTHNIFLWYKERTDGSDIEIKDSSIVWLYKECDPEFGNWQAKELEKTLKAVLAEYPEITTVHGKGFVEVKPRMLEKGESVRTILEEVRKKKENIDFVFCIGDDISDEPMFKTVNSIYSKDEKPAAGRMQTKDCASFTCTVGRKPSHASYYVNDYKDTLRILSAMALCSIKIPRNKSADDLIEFVGSRIDIHGIHSPPYYVRFGCSKQIIGQEQDSKQEGSAGIQVDGRKEQHLNGVLKQVDNNSIDTFI
eukprot:TRINITY_DN105531_c1_g1_i1.p1 TRINITY_DN105531_c1_g1~~TRINITY_DN105531_c1_g1_i1.p1  ORF type:complete len:882 (+),score=77.02 TRINITY_DN105531_c1_g1_i1:683-3328(+)